MVFRDTVLSRKIPIFFPTRDYCNMKVKLNVRSEYRATVILDL